MKEFRENIKSEIYSCGWRGKGLGVNSILCTCCKQRCHHRCSGLSNVREVQNLTCPARAKRQQGQETERDELKVNGGKQDEVKHFCYLGDVLDREAGSGGDRESEWRLRG